MLLIFPQLLRSSADLGQRWRSVFQSVFIGSLLFAVNNMVLLPVSSTPQQSWLRKVLGAAKGLFWWSLKQPLTVACQFSETLEWAFWCLSLTCQSGQEQPLSMLGILPHTVACFLAFNSPAQGKAENLCCTWVDLSGQEEQLWCSEEHETQGEVESGRLGVCACAYVLRCAWVGVCMHVHINVNMHG